MQTATGKTIRISLALDSRSQQRGLSGVGPDEFGEDQGMLFVYRGEGPRRFWMPDTHFDLDIIFLNADMVITAVEKNVPHHPGRRIPPPIYTTGTYRAKYVLEIKAGSPLSEDMKQGAKLTWASDPGLEEMGRLVRLLP